MTALNTASPDPLVELEPLSRGLLDRHLPTAKEWFPHEYVPGSSVELQRRSPGKAGDSGLSAVARTALELKLCSRGQPAYYHSPSGHCSAVRRLGSGPDAGPPRRSPP